MTNLDKLTKQLSEKSSVHNPKALAAFIGRRKLGAKAFEKRAIAGKRKASK